MIARLYKLRIWFILVLIASLRMFHMNDQVDQPHAWRQYDTKQYIDSYYFDQVDFLEPSVCWMGGYKTLLLEFPLPEYLVAKLYSVFGADLTVARIFFVFFFLCSVYFLYKSLQFVFVESKVPEMAALIYGILPLGLFYSRAIHIDFFVLAFAFGSLYFIMRAIIRRNFWSLLLACGLTSVGVVIKSPYFLFLIPPILTFAYKQKAITWFLMRAWIFIIPLGLLVTWITYSKHVNGLTPDWSFIKNYNQFTEMWYWYFGIWEQRVELINWITVGDRIFMEIIGWSGAFFGLIGLIAWGKRWEGLWTLSLLAGTFIYVFVFFNLNIIHNYYQLPILLVASVLIAMGIASVRKWLDGKILGTLAAIIAIIVVGIESIHYAESNYYTVGTEFENIAVQIQKNTAKEDLIIVCDGGLSPQCPLILQPAGRFGWSIPIHDITPAIIHRLYKEAGATHLAVVYNGYFTGEFQMFFEAMEDKIGIPLDDEGTALYMCRLKM